MTLLEQARNYLDILSTFTGGSPNLSATYHFINKEIERQEAILAQLQQARNKALSRMQRFHSTSKHEECVAVVVAFEDAMRIVMGNPTAVFPRSTDEPMRFWPE